jgi:outer membrane protein OmpA-like peptidoglycan-associated protein
LTGGEPLQLVTVSDRRNHAQPSGSSPWRWLVVPLAVVAAAGGWLVGRRTAPVKETIVMVTVPATTIRTIPSTTVPATVATTVPPPTTAEPTTVAPAPTTAPAPPTTAPAPAPTTAAPLPVPSGPVVPTVAQFVDGKLVLKGSVPSTALKAAIVARATALVGADHVTDQLTLDPRSVSTGGGPVLIGELVRFAAGSLDIPVESQPMLDAVRGLVAVTPSALVVVSSYTDDQGDPRRNIGLSAERIDAIAAQWTAKGIRPEQIIRDARGGADPIADNATDEGRAQNRRVSLTLYGLLG